MNTLQPMEEQVNNQQPKQGYLVDAREVASDIFSPMAWQHMKGMAETFVKSGAFNQDENAAKLMVKMQAGREMGMKPLESIKAFYFVKGTMNIFGSAITRRLREHGWKISYQDQPNKCTATISKGEESYTDTLTYEEAQKSGWTTFQGKTKPGWIEGVNRKLKLRYGVLSLMIKTYIPEVLGSAVDIAEVAEDMAPVIAGENKPETQLPASVNDDKPATEAQIKTIESLGGEVHEGMTFAEGAQKILELGKEAK